MEGTGVEWRGGEGRGGQGRVPDCLGGLSRVGISSRSTRPWNGQPPSNYYADTETQGNGTIRIGAYNTLIDYRICFDRIRQEGLWAMLRMNNISDDIVNTIIQCTCMGWEICISKCIEHR